jgi:hypothetical protein
MTIADIIKRLLDESWDNTIQVLVRTPDGKLFPLESVEHRHVLIERIAADMEGPLAHNENIVLLLTGHENQQGAKLRRT